MDGRYYDDNPCEVSVGGEVLPVAQRCGDFFLEARQFPTNESYVLGGIILLVCYTLLFLLCTGCLLEYVEFQPKQARPSCSD